MAELRHMAELEFVAVATPPVAGDPAGAVSRAATEEDCDLLVEVSDPDVGPRHPSEAPDAVVDETARAALAG